MHSLCDEIIETTINSKRTACFNDIVNPACFTAADAFRSISICSEKRYLTSHLTLLLQSNFVNFILTAEYTSVYAESVERQIESLVMLISSCPHIV